MLELPRISEDHSTRKLVSTTPRLSYWKVRFRHNPACTLCVIYDMTAPCILLKDTYRNFITQDGHAHFFRRGFVSLFPSSRALYFPSPLPIPPAYRRPKGPVRSRELLSNIRTNVVTLSNRTFQYKIKFLLKELENCILVWCGDVSVCMRF